MPYRVLLIILFLQCPDHGVYDAVVKTPFYDAFHPEAQLFRDVLTADIIRSTADLDAEQSFYIKSYSHECSDGLRRIAFPDMVDADPIAYFPGVLPDAGMETRAADELFFFPVEDAEGVVEAQVELSPEHTDEANAGFQILWLLLYPGQPGAKMLKAVYDGFVKPGCVARFVAA